LIEGGDLTYVLKSKARCTIKHDNGEGPYNVVYGPRGMVNNVGKWSRCRLNLNDKRDEGEMRWG